MYFFRICSCCLISDIEMKKDGEILASRNTPHLSRGLLKIHNLAYASADDYAYQGRNLISVRIFRRQFRYIILRNSRSRVLEIDREETSGVIFNLFSFFFDRRKYILDDVICTTARKDINNVNKANWKPKSIVYACNNKRWRYERTRIYHLCLLILVRKSSRLEFFMCI